MLEKDYTIVNYFDVSIVDGKRNYFITMNTDGKSSAKTPPMFLKEGEEKMTNDYSLFIETVKDKLK